jgi:MEMO1 family protein
MLVFAAIAPHSPLLIPTIGKERTDKLARTREAYSALEGELYAAKPDTLLIISPHGVTSEAGFALNLAVSYTMHLSDFGDLTTHATFASDTLFANELRTKIRTKSELPLVVSSTPALDYGAAIPLYLLTSHVPNAKTIPVYDSLRPIREHYEFGRMLHRAILASSRRVAVICSADLSQTLTDDAPGGLSPSGRKFDEAIVQLLREGSWNTLSNLEHMAIEAKACGYRPMMILHGILDNLNHKAHILSYEGPFGVGYLVAHLELH